MGRGQTGPPVRLGPLELTCPVLAAAGTSGHSDELGAYFDLSRIGGIVVKSLYKEPWPGNEAPRVTGGAFGMMNSVGLQGPGVARFVARDLPTLRACGATVVASIWGRSIEDFKLAASMLHSVPGVAALEVNVSCPNLEARDVMFAHSPDATAACVEAAGASGLPLFAKLSANVADLSAIASAAVEAGAAGVCLVNTALGLAIDPVRRAPLLGAGGGGVSGAGLHPIAVRAVSDVHRALPKVPIIGVGGVASVNDALELLLAGASAIEVGTATFVDPHAPLRIARGLSAWCARAGLEGLEGLVGAAFKDRKGRR